MKTITTFILTAILLTTSLNSYAVSDAEKQHIESHPLWFLIEDISGSNILAKLSNRSVRCKADATESQKAICRERVNKDIALMKKNGINVTVAQMFDPIFRKYQEIAIKRTFKYITDNFGNNKVLDERRKKEWLWTTKYEKGLLLTVAKAEATQ